MEYQHDGITHKGKLSGISHFLHEFLAVEFQLLTEAKNVCSPDAAADVATSFLRFELQQGNKLFNNYKFTGLNKTINKLPNALHLLTSNVLLLLIRRHPDIVKRSRLAKEQATTNPKGFV